MKVSLFVFIILLQVGCTSKKVVRYFNQSNFDTEYTRVLYADLNLDKEQYSYLENDSIIDLNQLSNKVELSKLEIKEFLSVIKDTTCFNKEGECGTYRDEACFIFYKKNKIIKIITVGCSYSYFSNCPDNFPCSFGSVKEPCDSKRYNKLLKSIWGRVKN